MAVPRKPNSGGSSFLSSQSSFDSMLSFVDMTEDSPLSNKATLLKSSRSWRKRSSKLGVRIVVALCALNLLRYARHRQPFPTSGATTSLFSLRSLQKAALTTHNTLPAVVDIVSVGSLLRPNKLRTQQETFGRQVRHFFPITERNDTDATCYTDLTSEQLDYILEFCRNTQDESYISGTLRKKLFRPKKHTGLLCGTKRALDGLFKVVMQHYENDVGQLPDYLLLIDDDTYLNLNSLVADLQTFHPPHEAHVVSGCHCDHLQRSGVTFSHDGFGTFFSKASLQQLMRPIECRYRQDRFSELACERLHLNSLGENKYFTNEMSVLELMYSFSSGLPFTQANHWTDSGYCFQSAHLMAFFIGWYNVLVPPQVLNEGQLSSAELRQRHSLEPLKSHNGTVTKKECFNLEEQCTPQSRICAGIGPSQMESLYRELQQGTPNNPKATGR